MTIIYDLCKPKRAAFVTFKPDEIAELYATIAVANLNETIRQEIAKAQMGQIPDSATTDPMSPKPQQHPIAAPDSNVSPSGQNPQRVFELAEAGVLFHCHMAYMNGPSSSMRIS